MIFSKNKKELNIFSITEKIIEYHVKLKGYLNMNSDNSFAKKAWQYMEIHNVQNQEGHNKPMTPKRHNYKVEEDDKV